MKFLKGILPNVTTALCLALGVLVVLNEFNPRLCLMEGRVIPVLIIICCILSIICGITLYAGWRREK